MDNHDQEVHVTRSTHDRKRMWQEMRQRNTNRSSEEGNPNTNKPKEVLEANEADQSQEALIRSNQSNTWNKEVLINSERMFSYKYRCIWTKSRSFQ